MTDQVRRFRAVAAAAAVAMVMAVAGCGESGAPPAGSSPTAAPSAKYDKATLRVCKLADTAAAGSDDAAFKAAADAVSMAATSDVAVLREISEKYAGDGSNLDPIKLQTGATQIQTWCLDHGLSKP